MRSCQVKHPALTPNRTESLGDFQDRSERERTAVALVRLVGRFGGEIDRYYSCAKHTAQSFRWGSGASQAPNAVTVTPLDSLD